MISFKSAPPPTAFVMIFGFSSNVQFGMIANTLACADGNTEKITRTAKRLAESVSERDLMASAACRLAHGSVLLVCLPVDEPESATNRKGLSVIYAVAAIGRRVLDANIFIQFLAAVDLAVSAACRVDAGNPTTTAAALTRLLQEESLGAISDTITHSVLAVANIFSALLSSSSRRHARFSSPDATWRTMNYGSNILAFDLAELALTKLEETRVDQLAQYFPFAPKNSHGMSNSLYSANGDKRACGYRFVEDGILLTFPSRLPRQ